MDVIGWLVEQQQREGLSDRQMAERLGYKRAGWNRLRLGKARVSLRLVNAACRAYPEHRDTIHRLALPDCAA